MEKELISKKDKLKNGLGGFLFLIGIVFWGPDISLEFFVVVFIVFGTVSHEFFHLLAFNVFGHVPWNKFKFVISREENEVGITWDKSVQISINSFRIGTVFPFIILGLLPASYGIFFDDMVSVGFAYFMTALATGDFVDIWLVRRYKGNDLIYPGERGFVVLKS
jgi:hypothetical protein